MPFNHREIVLPVEIEEEQSRSALTFLKIYRSELELFFQLLERQPVADLLARDRCCNYADSYLLATVLVYFKRAGLALAEYTVENFWLCLYLAHDQEEDEEELKWWANIYQDTRLTWCYRELLPWALGPAWRNHSLPFFQGETCRQFSYIVPPRLQPRIRCGGGWHIGRLCRASSASRSCLSPATPPGPATGTWTTPVPSEGRQMKLVSPYTFYL